MRGTVGWRGSCILLGPLLAVVVYGMLPTLYRDADGQWVVFSNAGRATLAMMVWMGTWWLTEALPISATALLPLAAFPLLGIADIEATASPYANAVIFLFLGGFLIAASMQRWGLDRRLALQTLRCTGTRPANLVGGFMVATAVMSAFVSNTATAATILPLALSIVELVERRRMLPRADRGPEDTGQLAPCLMLAVAYAASIGGLATLIGSPPNALLASFLRNSIAEPYRREVSFADWLTVGLPVVAVMLPAAWLLLTRVLFRLPSAAPPGEDELLAGELRRLGPWNWGERWTLFVFALAAGAWIARPLLLDLAWSGPGGEVRPLAGLSDAGIAITAVLALFLLPVDLQRGTFVLDWSAAEKVPWGILVLFGGGLSLAAAVAATGVTEFLGSQAHRVAGLPAPVLVALVTTMVAFLTELTSNTATAAALLPVLAAVAPGLGVHPYLLVLPAALAASCAFMLPVGTPPNALVFGTGYVTMPQMAKAGLWLNLVAIVVITVLTIVLVPPLFL